MTKYRPGPVLVLESASAGLLFEDSTVHSTLEASAAIERVLWCLRTL